MRPGAGLSRRGLLGAASIAATMLLSACAPGTDDAAKAARTPPASPAAVPATTTPPASPTPPPVERIALPPGTLTELPGEGNLLAWTADDGSSADVIAKYTEFARTTGTRLTFFPNACYGGWAQNADALRPLVASGQIQLGNHTFDHVDLTTLDERGVVDQLQRNHDAMHDLFGVDMRPYYRPPYGFHDERTDAAAASIGYTCPVLWYGSLSDSGEITSEQLLEFARQWFLPQHIVIGHLNFPAVTEVFSELTALIAERGLRTVTLDDVFLR